jgi:uncharacterized protein
MLIRFTVSNFLSFKEPTTFSMVASSERIHPHHVVRTPSRRDPNLLRMGVVYGANAAGKSNLVKALRVVRELVVQTRAPEALLPVRRFRIDPDYLGKPSIFQVEFRINDMNYAYSISTDQRRVHSEELRTTTSTSETLLFKRTTSSTSEVAVHFGSFTDTLDTDHRSFLRFLARGTRPNQLFLRETIERNEELFRPVYNWFDTALAILDPSGVSHQVETLINFDTHFKTFMRDVLVAAGTGITDVVIDEQPFGPDSRIPSDVIEEAQQTLPDGMVWFHYDLYYGERLVLLKRDGELYSLRLMTMHGDRVFELREESDGTQRLVDLIPMLYSLTVHPSEQVVVIDEIGRSLHPHLTQLLVDMHLDAANAEKRSQLVITTHETNLLDLDILRRDEIWFAEKKRDGSTDLYSLSDFQPRYDKNIRRDYLVGRYGAIPFIGGAAQLQIPAEEHATEPADAA